MTLDQLYYFRKLAQLQHFTKTAAELYITQPSLSSSMKNLEKELGVPLFQKRGRNVILTDYGKEFHRYVEEVLDKLDKGISILKHHVDYCSDKINIGMLSTFPRNYVIENVGTYKKTFPDTKFDIFTCIENKEIIKGINDGMYNLGFCFKVDEEKDLVFIPILKQDIVVLVKLGHELSKKRRLKLMDLQNEPVKQSL